MRIRTLTPIWTGDIYRECSRLRETAIIGSLRWWFEAIVRGLGGYACDPTSDIKCEYKNNRNDICAVCELFGTTSWARRFKLEIKQSFREIYYGNLIIRGNRRNWYYPSGLVNCDDIPNEIRQILQFDSSVDSILRVLSEFISEWCMIGGKTAIGYGVVRFEDGNGNHLKASDEDIDEFLKEYLKIKKNHGKNAKGAPKISEMFFAKFRVKENCIGEIINKIKENINVKNNEKQFPRKVFKCNDSEENMNDARSFLLRLKDYYGFIPVSALIRRELRRRIREKWVNNDELRHFLMGKLGRFSVINISHLYWTGGEWEFRIWGWTPKDLKKLDSNNSVSRSDVVKFIVETLNDKNFWKSVFGSHSFLRKSEEDKIVVEYPHKNWNFIDLGKLNDIEDIKKAFKIMVVGDENE